MDLRKLNHFVYSAFELEDLNEKKIINERH